MPAAGIRQYADKVVTSTVRCFLLASLTISSSFAAIGSKPQDDKRDINMILTKKILADMIMKYLNREIGLSDLISWAEDTMREADFENRDFGLIKDILARIGLADVREFGLTWDDCYDYLLRLGYNVKVELIEA